MTVCMHHVIPSKFDPPVTCLPGITSDILIFRGSLRDQQVIDPQQVHGHA